MNFKQLLCRDKVLKDACGANHAIVGHRLSRSAVLCRGFEPGSQTPAQTALDSAYDPVLDGDKCLLMIKTDGKQDNGCKLCRKPEKSSRCYKNPSSKI